MPANIDGGAQDPFLAMVVVYACPCHPASTLISGERPRAGTTVDIECRHDDVYFMLTIYVSTSFGLCTWHTVRYHNFTIPFFLFLIMQVLHMYGRSAYELVDAVLFT